jgi:hypothetical protein
MIIKFRPKSQNFLFTSNIYGVNCTKDTKKLDIYGTFFDGSKPKQLNFTPHMQLI